MTVAAFTLGCKVNQYDTDAILKDFANLGFEICNKNADVYIINTCTVTNISDKKSRQMINRAYKQNPEALIVAYGCYAQVNPQALSEIPGVAMVIGTESKHKVAEMVAEALNVKNEGTSSFSPRRSRAFIKIQDGCDRYCSYCIVPYARGGVVSRPIEDIMAEAEALVKDGCKEIVLSGIQIAAYGENDLYSLMQAVNDIKGLKRLRLGSLEPNIVNENFINTAKNLAKLCDHFHLSLQSGCDRTLHRMNRRYTTAQYSQAAEAIRSAFPQAALTTDIIVGFPGETDEDFTESLHYAEKIGFFRVHVFAYSAKKGTPAAEFPNQIENKTKEERSRIFRKLADKMNRNFYRQYLNKSMAILFESESDGIWEGHSTSYLTVRAPAKENPVIATVKLIEEKDGIAYGTLNKEDIK